MEVLSPVTPNHFCPVERVRYVLKYECFEFHICLGQSSWNLEEFSKAGLEKGVCVCVFYQSYLSYFSAYLSHFYVICLFSNRFIHGSPGP